MKYKNFWALTFFIIGSVFLFVHFVKGADTDIVITEICPTGCASKDHQWIEIYNKGEEAVDIEEWRFWEAQTNHLLKISEESEQQDFEIEPNEYAIIAQNDVYFFQDHQ